MGAYALGTWNTSAKQDKGISRLFNKMNRELILAAINAGTVINSGGTGYAVGNVLTLVDSGATTTPAAFTVTAVGVNGAVTGVALVDSGPNGGGVYASHQAAANHATTVAPAGGSGCVLRVNFYADVPDMVVRNGGILDSAVTSYAQQRDAEVQAQISAAIPSASDAQLANVATALGVTIPA